MSYEKYDIQNNSWTELGTIAKPHYKFGIAFGVKNIIYVIGGKTKVEIIFNK